MLQRTLGSGWGVLLPGLLIAGLMYADLSPDQWRIVILMGLVLTSVMLYHKQLRHYVLLPSCLALIAAIMLMIMNLNQGWKIKEETRKEVKIIGARGGT